MEQRKSLTRRFNSFLLDGSHHPYRRGIDIHDSFGLRCIGRSIVSVQLTARARERCSHGGYGAG